MSEKEKAQELKDKFEDSNVIANGGMMHDANEINCAIICINEILHALDYHRWQNATVIKYYEEVKKELEKLEPLLITPRI